MAAGIMDNVYPILGYVLAIAFLLVMTGVGFMAAASTQLQSSATTMASLLVLIALFAGIASVISAAKRT
jgi:hypothetical protein